MTIGSIGPSNGLSGIGRKAVDPASRSADSSNDGSDHEPRPSRALVLVPAPNGPREAFAPAFAGRASAPFLAQLIASRDNAPDLRSRRRAGPLEAARAYADAADRPTRFNAGRMLRQAM